MGASKPIIGLAGGIGSGKSCVAQEMRRLGAMVIDADRLAKQELDSQEVRDILVGWYGPSLLSAGGFVDRSKLAELIFEDPAERSRVESLLHPRVGRRRDELIRQGRADGSVKAIVLDVPLLFEVGMEVECDVVVFVDAPEPVRAQRLGQSRGWSPEELRRREKWHKRLDFKKVRADYIVDNGSSTEALRRQVGQVFPEIILSATNHKDRQGGLQGANPGVTDV